MIVVDASVALKWLIDEEHSDLALRLAERCARTGEPAIAPALLPFEIANVIQRLVRRTRGGPVEVRAFLQRFDAYGVELRGQSDLHLNAIELALRYNLGSTYDAHYVALAALTGAELWTADQRLIRSLRGDFAFVRWLGDFAA